MRIVWIALATSALACAQQPLTWPEIQKRFRANNPSVLAGQVNVQETKANEITANLRPNPNFNFAVDQLNVRPWGPISFSTQVATLSYLHERRHKRELRTESAVQGTAIAASQQVDLERTLTFSLRSAFVQLLQAKAVFANAKENIDYYDRELEIDRARLKSGDIAAVDEDRLELQRVQFEADLQNADVSLRTAKIQLLTLMNDRTPIDQFDVAGDFDFREDIPGLEELRTAALAERPDLRAAMQTVEQARTNYKLAVANGSTDPAYSVDVGGSIPSDFYVGIGVNIPLRIFDKNQGEKARTELDITHNERLLDASKAQVFSDVDSAYVTLMGTLNLLRPYKTNHLPRATKVRDTEAFAYKRGAATLLDFLDAEKSYRDVRLSYLNLIGSFLTAASQLNMAVGREVIP